MRKVNWLIVGIMSFVIILLLFGAGTLMEDWGYAPTASPLSWVGMIVMWLIPIGLIVLAGFGTVWLVRNVSHSKPPSS